ncbi:hypothetical protein HPB47_022781 [Ixodes persulcatus]|uniref:Uncharacterized protein n=1 Tax=Ixodes persulcatus TaxID=34615 RepID=A0AC60Q8P9_IXOPE|nr:hypothetical protein HPB47_022781 [Ixodes persulcatus]
MAHVILLVLQTEEPGLVAGCRRAASQFPEKWLFDALRYHILALQICDRALYGSSCQAFAPTQVRENAGFFVNSVGGTYEQGISGTLPPASEPLPRFGSCARPQPASVIRPGATWHVEGKLAATPASGLTDPTLSVGLQEGPENALCLLVYSLSFG